MATIQEAMSNSQQLLLRAANNQVAAADFKEEVTRLLASNLSARGFMAALATGSLPTEAQMRSSLIEGIKAGHENAYELIIKNIIMSGCSAQEHERKGKSEEAQGSKKACSASLELAALLNDPALKFLAGEAILAISQWPQKAGGKDRQADAAGLEKWFTFFERWGYSESLLAEVKDSLSIVAGEK